MIYHKKKEVNPVALRKESVDRNRNLLNRRFGAVVALRKESVDRNKVSLAYNYSIP